MTIRSTRRAGAALLLSGALVAAALGTHPAAAETPAEFYKGKTVTILSGFGAGGMYGLYSRAIIPHMSRHIPGQPTMIVQFMPGAGGVKAANYFANVAPKDGTVLGLLSQSIALTQVLRGGTTIRYDAAKMHWIGSFDTVTNVLSVWNATTKARRFADLKSAELIVGAPGKGSIGYMNMVMAQRVLGAKLKIIAGYAKVEDLDLAFERGEVAGRAATFISIITRKQDWIAGNKVTHLVQFGLKPHPSYPDVPLAQDLASDDEGRRMMRFIASPGTIGRGVSLPPGTPADRVTAMRAAFDATVADPAFLKEARSRKLPINHASAQEVTEAILETVNAPKSMVAKVAKIIAGK